MLESRDTSISIFILVFLNENCVQGVSFESYDFDPVYYLNSQFYDEFFILYVNIPYLLNGFPDIPGIVDNGKYDATQRMSQSIY